MKCLNCQAKGTHFVQKICPFCIEAGITREDILVKNQMVRFIGSDCGEESSKYIAELKADTTKNITHVKIHFVVSKEGASKDECHVTWKEYEKKSN